MARERIVPKSLKDYPEDMRELFRREQIAVKLVQTDPAISPEDALIAVVWPPKELADGLPPTDRPTAGET